MSDEPDQKFISEPERVPPGFPGPTPRRPRAGERGGAGPGQRGGGGEAPAAREVPGFRADFCVPGRLRHRPRARAGRRGRGRGAAGSPGVLTESAGPDFPAAVAAVSLRHPSPPGSPRAAGEPRPPFPLRLPPPRPAAPGGAPGSARGRSLAPRRDGPHALLHPRPLLEARLSWPGLGAIRIPAVPAAPSRLTVP